MTGVRENITVDTVIPKTAIHRSNTIGILGFGHMGQALCKRLHDSGFKTIIYDRDLARVQLHAPQGASAVSEIAGLVSCDVVLTSLPDDEALDAVTKAPEGLFNVLGKNTLHIATSTVSPALSRRLAASHSALGQGFLVAAILGNPDIVRSGQAFVLAGSKASELERATPMLSLFAQRVFHVSSSSSLR